MNTLYKISLLVLAIFVVAAATSTVDAQDNEEPNRFSVGLLGGVTQGHMNIGTEYDPTFGFNLRYAANPTVAFQTNFMFGEFTSTEDDGFNDEGNYYDRHFENSYFISSVTSQINMLRMLGSTSERVNLYANVGLGLIFNDVTTETRNQIGAWEQFTGEDHSEPAFFATFGTGLRFNLGHRVDLFAQYDYKIANDDLIDGHRTRPELDIDLHRRTQDHWSTITAGIQIKFGGSDKDADWHYVSPGVNQESFDRLEQRVRSIDDRVTENNSQIAALDEKVDENNRALSERMDDLERKLENLSQRVEEMDRVDLTFGGDILFELDSSVILDSAKPDLARVVRALSENPDRSISIEGHTCDLGTEQYNQGLSERRAEAVRDYLIQGGISEDRIETDGHGETQPLVDNVNESARMLNRRVEITIQ